MGIGDWGLGIGDWAQSPIPNPQSPIPNPHYRNIYNKNNILTNYNLKLNLIKLNKFLELNNNVDKVFIININQSLSIVINKFRT